MQEQKKIRKKPLTTIYKKSKGERSFKKRLDFRQGDFAVVSKLNPSDKSTQTGLTSVETCIKLYVLGSVTANAIEQHKIVKEKKN